MKEKGVDIVFFLQIFYFINDIFRTAISGCSTEKLFERWLTVGAIEWAAAGSYQICPGNVYVDAVEVMPTGHV
jgi:hypothetical protein